MISIKNKKFGNSAVEKNKKFGNSAVVQYTVTGTHCSAVSHSLLRLFGPIINQLFYLMSASAWTLWRSEI